MLFEALFYITLRCLEIGFVMCKLIVSLFLFAATLAVAQPTPPTNLRVGSPPTQFSGDFAGDPQSLKPYRTNLSEAEARHFLTHAAFGGTLEEVNFMLQNGLDSIVNRFVDGPLNADSIRDKDADTGTTYNILKNTWSRTIIDADNPLQERLAVILHDMLAMKYVGFPMEDRWYREYVELMRTHGLGNFRTLMKEIGNNGAMLHWLNGNDNVAGNPDENYAREFWELFTMGETSKYTQDVRLYNDADIVEAARSFTGWYNQGTRFVRKDYTALDGTVYTVGQIISYGTCVNLIAESGDSGLCTYGRNPTFVLSRHDDANKTLWAGTIYEVTGNYNADSMVDVTFDTRPEASEWIGMRLFTGLAHNQPSLALRKQLGKIVRDNNYDLKPVIRRILLSEAMFSDQARNQRIKNSGIFYFGLFRSTPIKFSDNIFTHQISSGSTGYNLSQPNSVNGWTMNKPYTGDEESKYFLGWLTSYGNILSLTARNSESDLTRHDEFLAFLGSGVDLLNAGDVVDRAAKRMDVALSAQERAVAITYYSSTYSGNPRAINPLSDSQLQNKQVSITKLSGLIWMLAQHRDYLMY